MRNTEKLSFEMLRPEMWSAFWIKTDFNDKLKY